MPLKVPTNELTDKEIHNLSELWEDTIYFIPDIDKHVDDNFTWIPTPGRFQKLIKEFRENEGGLNEQEREAERILESRPKIGNVVRGGSWWADWPTWKKIVDWLNSIHPTSTGNKETDPIRRDLNSLRAIFELGSPSHQIKTLEELLNKNHPLPQINEVKGWCEEFKKFWEKTKPNSNICFIKQETGGNLTFVFRLPFGNFYDLKYFLFYKQGVFYEYKGHERIWMNFANVIVHCQRSIFWNGYEKCFLKGFSGITLNNPKLSPKDSQCGCPPLVQETNSMEFEFAWQPTYSLWQVVNPMGSPKGIKIRGKGLNGEDIVLGQAFITHTLKKVTNDPTSWKLVDTIFYLLPKDYVSDTEKSVDERGQAYQEYIKSTATTKGYQNGVLVKPLGEIRRKHENKNQSLYEILTSGFKVKLKDGKKETIDLTKPEYHHLHDHINVKFYFNDKENYSCRLSDLDLKNIEIHIIANPAGIIYTFYSKRITFKFSESCKLIMEASRVAKAGIELAKVVGADAAKGLGKLISFIPLPGAQLGGKVLSWFGSKRTEIEKLGDSATRIMSEWDKTLESKTQDSKSGADERQGERKSQMSGITIPDRNARARYPSRKQYADVQSSGSYSRTSEGTRSGQSKTIGQGDSLRSSEARSTSVSYSFSPAQTTTAVLGTIPSMMATSHLDNDYSLLDLILRKKSPAFTMSVKYNKPLINYYVKNLRIRKKEGHKLECKPVFANLIDIAGFHKYITHMMEGDTNGFFTDLFNRGVELYKTTPKEIWNLDLGELEVPKDNMIIKKLVAEYTNIEEINKELGSTDSYAYQDQRVWLNYASYLYKEGESEIEGRTFLRKLVESNQRPKTGYRDTFLCDICKRNGQNNSIKCYEKLDPEDTQHPEGDVMRAHTTNQSILETNWTIDNTKFWKEAVIEYPGSPGEWVTKEYTYDGMLIHAWYSQEEAERARDEKKRSGEWGGRVKNVELKGGYVASKSSFGPTERTTSESTYDSWKKDSDRHCWTSTEGGTYIPNMVEEDNIRYNAKGRPEIIGKKKVDKGGKMVGATTVYYSKKIIRGKDKYGYWLKWRELVGQSDPYNRTEKISISKEEYETLLKNCPSNTKLLPPEPPDEIDELLRKPKPASYKFAIDGSWQSHRVNLDSKKKYVGYIYTFHDGRGDKNIEDPGTNDGSPWQCWLEQRGTWIGIVFNRVKITSIEVGDTSDLGGGVEYTDERDFVSETSTDNTWTADSEGVQQTESEQHQEQTLSLQQLEEALHLSQEEIAKEYTEEQARQIHAEQTRRAEQAKQAKKEEEEEEWEDLSNTGRRNRKR